MGHKNRNWHRRWVVDLEAGTVSHQDGWVFAFKPHQDGGFEGRLIAQPENLTAEQMAAATKITNEAAKAWQRERDRRH